MDQVEEARTLVMKAEMKRAASEKSKEEAASLSEQQHYLHLRTGDKSREILTQLFKAEARFEEGTIQSHNIRAKLQALETEELHLVNELQQSEIKNELEREHRNLLLECKQRLGEVTSEVFNLN